MDTNKEKWFERYVAAFRNSLEVEHKKWGRRFLCPCCNYPTLRTRHEFSVCYLCEWEDDGQDEHNADEILGGPNGSYSLKEARENFRNYQTSYRPSDKYHFERTTVKKAADGMIVKDLVAIKQKLMAKYDILFEATEQERRRLLPGLPALKRRLRRHLFTIRIKR